MTEIYFPFVLLYYLYKMFSNITSTKYYALMGLNSWFTTLIPCLFPFMVISNLLIESGYYKTICSLPSKVIGKLYKCSDEIVFIILSAILFGFPLGLVNCLDLQEKGLINDKEAEFTTLFCNIYSLPFIFGIVLARLNSTNRIYVSFIYIISHLIIGLIFRYSIYRKTIRKPALDTKNNKSNEKREIILPIMLQKAIKSSGINILMLGGYIIISNMSNILFNSLSSKYQLIGSLLCEVTGAINMINQDNSVNIPTVMFFLTLSGLSGILQAGLYLSKLNIPIWRYFFSKLLIATIIYILLFFSGFSSLTI